MALQFVTKRFRKRPEIKTTPQPLKKEVVVKTTQIETTQVENEKEEEVVVTKNKKEKKKKDMITKEQLAAIETATESINPTVKVVKKDRGLIERTESSKIIITEDNRQVLND